MKYLKYFGIVILIAVLFFVCFDVYACVGVKKMTLKYGTIEQANKHNIHIAFSAIGLALYTTIVTFTLVKKTKFNLLLQLIAVTIVMSTTVSRVSFFLPTISYDAMHYEAYSYMIGFPVCIGAFYIYAAVVAFIKFIYPKIKTSNRAE